LIIFEYLDCLCKPVQNLQESFRGPCWWLCHKN